MVYRVFYRQVIIALANGSRQVEAQHTGSVEPEIVTEHLLAHGICYGHLDIARKQALPLHEYMPGRGVGINLVVGGCMIVQPDGFYGRIACFATGIGLLFFTEPLGLGWIVALGNTPKETIDTMLNQVKMLPDGVTAHTESLVELLKEIESAEEQGIEFSNKPLPEPESVVAK